MEIVVMGNDGKNSQCGSFLTVLSSLFALDKQQTKLSNTGMTPIIYLKRDWKKNHCFSACRDLNENHPL